MKCPKATYDLKENLEYRDRAFKDFGYGPANPDQDDAGFWKARAEEWNTSVDEAKTMRCGNCAAFIQTPEMMACIVKGIQGEESNDETYAPEVSEAANLGYCELLEFKCAAGRVCSAWLVGGPITKALSGRKRDMVLMAKAMIPPKRDEDEPVEMEEED
jgi:hypothetical protein